MNVFVGIIVYNVPFAQRYMCMPLMAALDRNWKERNQIVHSYMHKARAHQSKHNLHSALFLINILLSKTMYI